MRRVSSGLIESRLAALAACAPPLDASAAALLSAQQSPADGAELPALAAVCSTLGVPLSHSAEPHEASSLPMRLVAGAGTAAELSLWRVLHDGALHELLTLELLDALVQHLTRTLERCRHAGIAQPTILEVGAGDGVLAHHLARRLGDRAHVVAVDDGSSRIGRRAEVLDLDQAAALERFEPQVVLACWMPSGVDWTCAAHSWGSNRRHGAPAHAHIRACTPRRSAGFRGCASVREYLLLGRPRSSTCGDEWATCGRAPPSSAQLPLPRRSAADTTSARPRAGGAR